MKLYWTFTNSRAEVYFLDNVITFRVIQSLTRDRCFKSCCLSRSAYIFLNKALISAKVCSIPYLKSSGLTKNDKLLTLTILLLQGNLFFFHSKLRKVSADSGTKIVVTRHAIIDFSYVLYNWKGFFHVLWATVKSMSIDCLLVTSGIFAFERKELECNFNCTYCVFSLWSCTGLSRILEQKFIF